MSKAFLSYSSKQAWYVEIVARNLGKSKIIFDKWTFEEGNKTIDEIFQGLSETSIFVFFISNDSLDSPWVRQEIDKAYELIESGNHIRLFPLIIDSNIKYDDNRIPKWIQETYNLKYVSKPTKASERIKQTLKNISYELNPKNKALSQLFIGRTDLIRIFEQRIYDSDQPQVISTITSGIPSIGRRKFTFHVLKNLKLVRYDYAPATIIMGSRDGIEDLIVYLYDLGFSQKEREELFQLLNRDMKDKIDLAIELILEIEEHENLIFIIDNYAIVSQDANIVDWFKSIIRGINKIDRLFLCLISRCRISYEQLRYENNIFAIEIPELEKYERSALFQAILDIEDIEINKGDLQAICKLFNGFPEQIFFTLNTIRSEGVPYVMKNLHIIPDFNSEKAAQVIQKYESNEFAKQVLGFLSECEFVSLDFLEAVFNDDSSKLQLIINEFSNIFIIEFIGATKEYLRLNDTIRDYIQRIGVKLNPAYRQNLKNHVISSFKNYDTIDRDISDYVISMKEAIKDDLDIPEELLLPSHFLNAMRDLYNNEKRYKDVIKLAERVLLQKDYIDERIVREVIYWLCLSLARRKDNRLLKEVQNINGPDHNFLLGFYYRLSGRNEDAIEKLSSVLKQSPDFYRAKRELVQVYINIEEYEKAYNLAKENYIKQKNNPYAIQSYFRCLIGNNSIEQMDKKTELSDLLKKLNENPLEKAKEMYMIAKAQYIAYIDYDEIRAINAADEAITIFPKSIYPPLIKIEICRKFSKWDQLESLVDFIDKNFHPNAEIFSRLGYISAKSLVLARKGDYENSMRIIDLNVKYQFGEKIYNNLLKEIELTK